MNLNLIGSHAAQWGARASSSRFHIILLWWSGPHLRPDGLWLEGLQMQGDYAYD
jgi:hypothetical protein